MRKAREAILSVLEQLRAQLAAQEAGGQKFFFGGAPCALDFYWACFMSGLFGFSDELFPDLPPFGKAIYTPCPGVEVPAVLVAHRDMMYRDVMRGAANLGGM